MSGISACAGLPPAVGNAAPPGVQGANAGSAATTSAGGPSASLSQAIADLQAAVSALAQAVSQVSSSSGAGQASAGTGALGPVPQSDVGSSSTAQPVGRVETQSTPPASEQSTQQASDKPGSAPAGYRIHAPLPGARVSSPFGEVSEIRNNRPHGGIDLVKPAGTPILAAAPGKVIEITFQSGGGGNMITIDHGNGRYTRYAHMIERSPLKVGDVVAAGDQVGKVGATGNATGPHLHFEVMLGGTGADRRVNPAPYLSGEKLL